MEANIQNRTEYSSLRVMRDTIFALLAKQRLYHLTTLAKLREGVLLRQKPYLSGDQFRLGFPGTCATGTDHSLEDGRF